MAEFKENKRSYIDEEDLSLPSYASRTIPTESVKFILLSPHYHPEGKEINMMKSTVQNKIQSQFEIIYNIITTALLSKLRRKGYKRRFASRVYRTPPSTQKSRTEIQ